MKIEGLADLARLEWFGVRDPSRIVVLAKEEVGPIIDLHTHLAMGFLRRLRVDVERESPRTAYYLPEDAPIDLEVYSNRNIGRWDRFRMKLDLSLLSLTGFGMRRTHTAPNLLRDMDDLGIVASVLLPFDLPWGAQNADVALEAARRHARLLPFGSVHPRMRGAENRLDTLIGRGALGMKIHPNGQFIAADDPNVVRFCGACGKRGVPVLFHCGPVGIEPASARRRCRVERYEAAIAENPQTRFVLGHSGALEYEQALRFAKQYPNTFFELSCLGQSAVERVLAQVPTSRVMFGSDWPFYHPALTLARVLLATRDAPALRRAVLYENAARLVEYAA